MFTRNYKSFIEAHAKKGRGVTYPDTYTFYTDSNQSVSVALTSQLTTQTNYSSNFLGGMLKSFNENEDTTNGGRYGVRFGSGTTAPTKNDYTIENPISYSSYEMNVPTALLTNDSADWFEYSASYVIVANTDITISEIGLYAAVRYSQTFPSVLIDRTLLDAPVTLAAGESTTRESSV